MELVGMIPLQGVLPLEGVMPGWPEVETPSLLTTAFIALGIPLIIALVIIFLGKGHELRQGSVENGVAVGLPASNPRLAIEDSEQGSQHDEDRAEQASVDSAEPDNQLGSHTA